MMTKSLPTLFIGLALVACSGGDGPPIDPQPSSSANEVAQNQGGENPGNPGGETPAPKLEVTASIISATLGDNCEPRKPSTDLCAPSQDANGCGPICRKSNVQISFKAGAGSAAKIAVTSVALLDAKANSPIETLTSSTPQIWKDNAYVAWDEMLAPSSDVRTSYDLSSPKWSAPAPVAPGTGKLGTQYRLRVTFTVDGGAPITIESALLTREPPVVT